jgi:hypothetical protein
MPKVVVPPPRPGEAVPPRGAPDKQAAVPAPGADLGATGLPPAGAVEEPKFFAPKTPKEQEPPKEKKRRLRRSDEGYDEAPEPPSLTSEERAAFWGDIEKPRRKARQAGTVAPLPGQPEKAPVQPGPAPETAQAASAAQAARRPVDEAASKDEVTGDVEEAAGKAAPAPMGKVPPSKVDTGVETQEKVIPPDEIEVKDHFAPRLPKRGAHRREKPSKKTPAVALQTPEEYDGEVTQYPSYLKAVLFGLLAGLLLAMAYAGFEWWRHSGRWILGWIVGFVVGIVVVFASGRHFNWKLGLMSALITWFSLCIGQIVFSMLDVRFNNVFPLKLPFPTLLRQAVTELGNSLGSLWLIMFIVAGVVAFLVSFRPWPVRFEVSPSEDERVSPETSEREEAAPPGV